MSKLTLYIANKNYSSWSFRPWLAMEACGVPFEEVLIPFDFPAGNPRFHEVSPTAQVPVLHDGELRVWESLSIIEYVAELYPDAGLWPADSGLRAQARSISMEMLSGFRAMRNACPMNLRRPKRRLINLPDGVMADVARIESIWRNMRAHSGGPFLFGAFSAADAMFAPVVNRFATYIIPVRPETQAYMDAVSALPAWQAWIDGARAEPWSIARHDAI